MKKLIDQHTILKIGSHLAVIFGLLSCFSSSLSCVARKSLLQSDSQQYKGMSRELQENREKMEKNCIGWTTPLVACRPIS